MKQPTKSRYRYAVILLKQLVKTDFKLRYQSSFLGYLWSLLKPLFLFIIMYALFVKVLNIDYGVEDSGSYLFLGLVIWFFFSELTSGSVGSIVGKGELLRKINFPRYAIVLASAVSSLVNLTINMVVVAIFMAISGFNFSLEWFLAPLLLAEVMLLGLGLAFFLSAAFVKLRDIGYIWEVIMQALFYATPIFFPLDRAPIWAEKILMLNPLAQSIQDLRYLLIDHNTNTIGDAFGNQWVRLAPVGLTLFIWIGGMLYFRSKSKYFAEEI